MQENKVFYELEVPKCPVCWDEIHNCMIALGCGHVFHKECIKDWKKNYQSCPNCRHRIKQNSSLDLFYSLKQKVSNYYYLQVEQNLKLYELSKSSQLLQNKLEKIQQGQKKQNKKLNDKKINYNQLSQQTNTLMNFNQQIKTKILDLKKKKEKQDIEQRSKIKDIILLKGQIKCLIDKQKDNEKNILELFQKNQILSEQLQQDSTLQFAYEQLDKEDIVFQLQKNIIKLTVEVNKQYFRKQAQKRKIDDLKKYETKKEQQIKNKNNENKILQQQIQRMQFKLAEKIKKHKKIQKKGQIQNKSKLTNLNKQFNKYINFFLLLRNQRAFQFFQKIFNQKFIEKFSNKNNLKI